MPRACSRCSRWHGCRCPEAELVAHAAFFENSAEFPHRRADLCRRRFFLSRRLSACAAPLPVCLVPSAFLPSCLPASLPACVRAPSSSSVRPPSRATQHRRCPRSGRASRRHWHRWARWSHEITVRRPDRRAPSVQQTNVDSLNRHGSRCRREREREGEQNTLNVRSKKSAVAE